MYLNNQTRYDTFDLKAILRRIEQDVDFPKSGSVWLRVEYGRGKRIRKEMPRENRSRHAPTIWLGMKVQPGKLDIVQMCCDYAWWLRWVMGDDHPSGAGARHLGQASRDRYAWAVARGVREHALTVDKKAARKQKLLRQRIAVEKRIKRANTRLKLENTLLKNAESDLRRIDRELAKMRAQENAVPPKMEEITDAVESDDDDHRTAE